MLGLGISLSTRATIMAGAANPYSDYLLADDFDSDSYWQRSANTGSGGTLAAAPSSLAGYTFTATGSCYELNSDGTLAGPFAANVPTITDEGYKARQSFQNLVLQSQTFDNASWGAALATVTANAATAPDGTVTADKLASTAGSAGSIAQSITKDAATVTYTYSVFAKAAGFNWLELALFDTVADGTRAWFNLATGAIGSTAAIGAGFTSVSHSIVACGSGWYRCTLKVTSNTATTLQALVYPTNADAVVSNGDGSSGVNLWGASLYAASTAGPYIVTTTGAATRGEALLTHNIFEDGSALTDQDMLIWAKGTPGEIGTNTHMLMLHDGTTANTVVFETHSGNAYAKVTVASSLVVSHALAAVVSVGTEIVLLLRRTGGQWRGGYYQNGVLTWLAVAETDALPAGLTKATVGNSVLGSARAFRGTIDSAFIKPGTFSTDAEVITAITGTP